MSVGAADTSVCATSLPPEEFGVGAADVVGVDGGGVLGFAAPVAGCGNASDGGGETACFRSIDDLNGGRQSRPPFFEGRDDFLLNQPQIGIINGAIDFTAASVEPR